jgi:carboxypeptidase family protein
MLNSALGTTVFPARAKRALLMTLCFLFIWSQATMAQLHSAQRSWTISGVVTDATGAVIPDAEITLEAANKTVKKAQSAPDGSFGFTFLNPGDYVLEISHSGFRTARLWVAAGLTPASHIAVALPVATELSEVTVTAENASVSIENAENRNTNELDSGALSRLPIFDQDYIALMSRFLDTGAVGTNGVVLVVNGIEGSGPGVTASAIKSVKVNNNPYSALYARPGRGRLEIETKEGTPDYHGQLNLVIRNAVFDARQAYSSIKPPEEREYFEGSATGPLLGKKDSFLVSGSYDRTDNQAVVNAATPAGNVNLNVPTPYTHALGSLRVFHDFRSGHQLWIGYSYERQVTENQGVGGIVLPEAGYKTEKQEHEIDVADTLALSPKWLNQLHMLVGHQDQPAISNVEAPSITVPGAFTGGGAQMDSNRTEAHWETNDTVSYSSGGHQIKFGLEVSDFGRRGMDDWTNQLGSYVFSSLAAYSSGIPTTLLLQQGNGHVILWEKNFAGFVEDNYKPTPNLSIAFGIRYYFQNYFHDDANNIAPRLGFSWAPGKTRHTVIRGGAGIFYDRTGSRPIADLLHFNGSTLHRYLIDSPQYPGPVSTVGLPTSLVVLASNALIPYSTQWSLGLEHQVRSKMVLTAEWIGLRGVKLFRSLDTNAPIAGNIRRPDDSLGQVRTIDSGGRSSSNALEVSLKGSLTKWFKGQAQYRMAKATGDTEGITFFPENSYAPELDYGRSSFDERHRFSLLGTLSLPNKFSLGANATLSSGKPFDETTGQDNNHDGIFNDRPALVSRNALNGPSFSDVDLRLGRDFRLGHGREDRTLNVSLSAFNILNKKNDFTYIGVIASPFFGRAVTALAPRRMQMNVSFKF